MRHSQMLIPTVKETPADAVVVSHRLMLRAGYIRKLAAGIYVYLPLAQRVFAKVANIVREEMNKKGAQEITMPAVQPGELWQQSGRWDQYGPELLRFKDRKGSDFVIGPTHEEVVTSLVAGEVKSYRQLPLNLYQIQTKFRDEVRPRFGLMRGREFVMKDAYSFHATEDDAHREYEAMVDAYHAIFRRCGLVFRAVEADTGSIGGNRSHEFQVLADSGEDAIVYTVDDDKNPTYAANVELAPIAAPKRDAETPKAPAEVVQTPGKKTIDDVSKFLGVEPARVIKAVLFIVDEKPVMALCQGSREVNEVKLKKALGAKLSRLMTDAEVATHTGAPAGYAGPVDAKAGLTVIADHGLTGLAGLVCGANVEGAHRVQVALGRDFTPTFGDLVLAHEGDVCDKTERPYLLARGIEVGHVFFLGTKYSEAMGAQFLDAAGEQKPFMMGCYGIGVTRTAAAAIEQNHDDDGIRWPAPIAPFHVSLIALGTDDETMQVAGGLYAALTEAGLEVLFDDRDERPGSKFKDHDLIGNPVRVAVGGKGLKEGIVEVKLRTVGKDGLEKVPVADAAARVIGLVRGLLDAAH